MAEVDHLVITRPDDMHLHLRDGAQMRSVLGHSAGQFARAVVMPNLKPPIYNCEQALDYRRRICAALPAGSNFSPLMTLYLTQHSPVREVVRLAETEHIVAFKYYPAGATTHAEQGVTDLFALSPVLDTMQKHRVPLLLHGEVVDPQVDVFDREAVFIERVLAPLQRQFPELRMVLEHISTTEAVDFIRSAPAHITATITAHHLLLSRDALFHGGLRPHHYCLPILKSRRHQQAVLAAATSGSEKFFLGTDSAPHARGHKERDCGCAGVYTAHAAMPLYAEVFAQADSLDALEAFSSRNGARFYGLPRNAGELRLSRTVWEVPGHYPFASETLVPFRADSVCRWQVRA